VQIALAEAVNNVVEHAYRDAAPGDVNIQCSLQPDQLLLNIFDAGVPLPDEKLPAGKPADLSGPLEDLPEGGFGWFLIRTLTNEIRYQRHDGSNELSLTFEVEKDGRQ
jgi:serine/threonine-protein kinase RsbW